MNALAVRLARFSWARMLWLMRRPWMKDLQRASMRLIRETKRERAKISMHRQNRLARRFGLPLLTLAFNLLLASMILTTSYFFVLNLYESGALSVPESIRKATVP